MMLAALGVVTVGIGVALDLPGLIGIGLFWVVVGLLARRHAGRLKGLAAAQEGGGPTGVARQRTVIHGRTFALGTLLWFALGLPSLAVGVFEVGIGAGHESWRWLPIAVGGLALSIGGVSAVMYLVGSAAFALAEEDHKSDVAATLWIRALRETGTYVNERPRLEFEFLVEPDPATGLASYEVTKKATVPFTATGSLRVGSGFKALVAGRVSPASMEIHWDEVGSADPRRHPDVSYRLDELDRLHRDAKITDEEYHAQRGRILGSL